jgi:membrane protein
VTATDAIDRLRRFLAEDLWRIDLRSSRLVTWCVRALQLVVMAGEGFVRDRVLVRATALAYVTSLALIPVLAIAFSIIGAFGIREDVARFSLGTLGAAVLFATTILTVGNVERAFNDIFGVRLQRTWTRRLPDYLAVLVVAPLLVGVALSLGTVVRSQWVVQRMLEVESLQAVNQVASQAPILLLYGGGFAFLYWFLPNTTVRPLSALLGGAVAALLFNGAQVAYVGFNVGAARYDALFSTFAVLPLFLIWIYVSWAIVLLGAEIAYAHQHLGRYSREVRTGEARAAQLETLGLAVALEVARAFRDGGRPLTADALATELDVAIRVVRDVLSDLELAGIVAPRGGDPREGSMQLGRPAEHITVSDVRTALRGPAGELPAQPGLPQLAARISREIDAEGQRGAGAHTLADLLTSEPG